MKTALLGGIVSLTANLLILSAFMPLAVGFRSVIILQITFWTFFAAIGAAITMALLHKNAVNTAFIFVVLAFIVFFLSLIPIYLHVGILHDFPSSFSTTAVDALITMHVADSLSISGLALAFAYSSRGTNTSMRFI